MILSANTFGSGVEVSTSGISWTILDGCEPEETLPSCWSLGFCTRFLPFPCDPVARLKVFPEDVVAFEGFDLAFDCALD